MKKIKVSGLISFVLGILSFMGLLYFLFFYVTIKQRMPVSPMMEALFGYGYITFFLFHVSVFITLVLKYRTFKNLQWDGILSLLTGGFSFFYLYTDFAALTDIGHEYARGAPCTGEWWGLFIGFIPHSIFLVSLFIMFFKLMKYLQGKDEIRALKIDESLYWTINSMGVVCGLMGLALTLYAGRITNPWLGWYMLVLLMPYCIIIFFWLVSWKKGDGSKAYDEKQKYDVIRAAATTLLVSIPAMIVLFVLYSFKIYAHLFWFPFYIFMSLLVFSGSALCYYKR